MQKTIILIGCIIVLIGIAYPYLRRLPFGRLPGDILYEKDGFTFFFPLMTCIVISIIITIILHVLR